MHMCEKMFNKELAHTVTETGKSQGLQCEAAFCRARRANGLLPVQVQRPENQEGQSYSSSPKANRLKVMIQFGSEGRRPVSQFDGSQARKSSLTDKPFRSIQVFNRLGKAYQ